MEPWVWALLLLMLGIGLAVMEVFFTSAGILAVLSFISLMTAVVMGFNQGPVTGGLIVLGVVAGLPTVIILAFKYWPKTAMGRRVLLVAPKSDDVLPEDPNKDWMKGLIGRTGRAKSKLLLSGVITVDGRTVEAVSESMPVEIGQTVLVIQVRGQRVVVRPVAADETPQPPPSDPLTQTFDDPFEVPRLDSDPS
jgi:membrane-bound ClpP family serine protease